MSCVLAVAAAQTASPFYYRPAQHYSYSAPVERAAQYENVQYANAASSPVVKSAPFTQGSGDVDFATLLADFSLIGEMINDPYLALEKAQGLLEDLNNDLPDALAKMDPYIKKDIKEVNGLILEICDRAVANARPSDITSYYSPSAMKKTCAFLQKHVPTVSRGMDDPEVITNIIAKLRKFGRLSKEMADLFV